MLGLSVVLCCADKKSTDFHMFHMFVTQHRTALASRSPAVASHLASLAFTTVEDETLVVVEEDAWDVALTFDSQP